MIQVCANIQIVTQNTRKIAPKLSLGKTDEIRVHEYQKKLLKAVVNLETENKSKKPTSRTKTYGKTSVTAQKKLQCKNPAKLTTKNTMIKSRKT